MKNKYKIFNITLAFSLLLSILTGTTIQATDFVVTSTDNSGPGTLRQAILDANNHQGPDKIVFNIPTDDQGFLTSELSGQPGAAFFIRLVEPLPKITDVVIIDGKTQTEFTGNTNPTLPGFSGAEIFIMFNAWNLPYDKGNSAGIHLERFPHMEGQTIFTEQHGFIIAATVLVQDVELVVLREPKEHHKINGITGNY